MKTRTHVYLESMSPDGTYPVGAVKEMQVSDEAPQYLEPLAANDDLGKLRANVHEARAKLHHAKSRGDGVAEAQKAFEDAKQAMDSAHRGQQKKRQHEQIGADSPFARQSEDKRQFMPVRDYSVNDDDNNDTTGRSFDDEQDDELEAKILAAVAKVEQAQSDGASWAEVLRLEENLRALRSQLPNPSAPPAATTAAPPRKSHIERPGPTQPTGQAAAPAEKTSRAGWDKFLADFDAEQAKEALSALRTGPSAPAYHAKNTCCSAKYLCAECRRKKAAA